ncbi:UMP kinase [Candidatus Bathyarchaeota archaeon]|nr:UMP kinase [Candidatus Bathyarchaeota archaeon]
MIKIGGHVFASRLDPKIFLKYSELLKKLRKNQYRIVVIVGGGEEARRYIRVAKKMGGSEFICDVLGIEVSRLNARLLITGLGEDAYPEPPRNLEELRKAFESNKIVVMGGLQPGQSTNAVGILAAEAIDANLFINATDVDGVYTSNPKEDRTARKLEVVGTEELLALFATERLEAGSYTLFDPLAIKIVERSGIPTRIVNGLKTVNIERALRGEAVGTLVKPSRREIENDTPR